MWCTAGSSVKTSLVKQISCSRFKCASRDGSEMVHLGDYPQKNEERSGVEGKWRGGGGVLGTYITVIKGLVSCSCGFRLDASEK